MSKVAVFGKESLGLQVLGTDRESSSAGDEDILQKLFFSVIVLRLMCCIDVKFKLVAVAIGESVGCDFASAGHQSWLLTGRCRCRMSREHCFLAVKK